MVQHQWIELSIALVCALLAGLLSAADAALANMSRGRAEVLVEEGRSGARRAKQMADDPAPYVNTALFLRTTFEIVSIVLVGMVVYDHFRSEWQQALLTAGVMVLVSFILWGVAPRTIGRQKADKVLLSLGGLLSLLTTVFGPVASLMILIGNALTPGRGYTDGPFASEAELRDLVDQAEASAVIDSEEREMIHSVFELGDTIVREVMVPRTDVVFIDRSRNLRQGLSLALRSGFSRIPVVGAGLDDVLGILYLKDLVRRTFDNPGAEKTETVESIMRAPHFVPDSKPVSELLREMQTQRNHVVIVVDEFGGTAGVASIEDILEEIVGEIVDEYDPEPIPTQEVEPGVFRVAARLNVEELGDLFGMDLDDEDVDSVGGVMAKVLNMVPIPGSTVDYEGLRIVAETAGGRRHQIETCLVSRVPEDADEDETVEESHE